MYKCGDLLRGNIKKGLKILHNLYSNVSTLIQCDFDIYWVFV